MTWKIKIEGKPRQKILIAYNTMDETITFIGLYKLLNTTDWVKFVEKVVDVDFAIENNTDIMFEIYEDMKAKIEKYEKFSTLFATIKDIEIVGEEKDNLIDADIS